LPAGDETRAPLVVEATSPTSLDTTRAVVRLAARGAPGERAAVRLAEPPVDVARDARFAHVCRAHADGFGGFAVVCRVATAANAADVAGDDAAEGVFVLERGHAALARLDVDLGARDFDAKAVGYNARGRGVVVRAEASRLPGEAAPSFVLASDARLQPVVPRRFICRMPLIDPTGDVAF
ncbi:MAG TPA: hypothetical protein VHB21_00985, partial [Minicystis sp.]|nr:hypothetical protein [Minicystis sp.]